MNSAQKILIDTTKAYPNAWNLLRGVLEYKAIWGNWPDWCFMPLAIWRTIACALEKTGYPSRSQLENMDTLAALGAWRYTEGIYKVNHALLHLLTTTVPKIEMSLDVFRNLPEWCVYVETHERKWMNKPMPGFFAHLEYNFHGRAELRIIPDTQEIPLQGLSLYLGPWTINEAVSRMIDDINLKTALAGEPTDARFLAEDPDLLLFAEQYVTQLSPLVSILVYLCGDSPDIAGDVPGARPAKPQIGKTYYGWTLVPADKPQVWHVGDSLGEAFLRMPASVQ